MGGRIAFLLFLLSLAELPSYAVGPPIRSTHYDGTGQAYASFPHQAKYDSSVSMTVEAWIYRESATRCETIVGHHWTDSWWLGLCPNLRFYRSGGSQASSSVTIHPWKWTHVAVSYDGTNARFYINGVLRDTVPLSNAGGGRSYPLVIGADWAEGSYSFPFLGAVDEVRIWSTVRTQQQISDNRFKELRNGPGLVAAFGKGGAFEDTDEVAGTAGSGTAEQVIGILPRDLVVPKAAITPTVNGLIDGNGEYAGAERLVLPYGTDDTDPDALAWLVYTDTAPQSLYVAVGVPRHNTGGKPYSETSFGLLLDPVFSRNNTPQETDVWLHTYLDTFNYGFDEVSYWWNGNGSWYEQCLSGGQPCTPPTAYNIGKAWCTGDELNVLPPCVEFRIDKSILGEWNEFDGLALTHQNWNPSNPISNAPGDADAASPKTWAKVSYGDSGVTLPQAKIAGKVRAGLLGNSSGLANWRVTMIAGGSAYETFTDASGNFSFDVTVPENEEIQIQADNCGFCKYRNPTFSGNGIPGTITNELVVKYPGCTNATCQYQNVDFYILQTLGPVSVTGVNVASPTPKLTLRDNPTVVSKNSASVVTFTGANFHEFIDVNLSPVAPTVVCPCPDDWVLFKGTILSISPDRTQMQVLTPTLPGRVPLRQGQQGGNPFGSGYRWVLEDTWTRPNMVTYNLWPHPQANPNSFPLTEPEFPYIWGFGFINKYGDPGWREFSAVYGDNAYYCVGAFGYCATHVMDPVYAVFYPIYYLVGKAMTGSCGGMASVSQLFQQGDLHTQDFDPNVYFPAGFRQADQNYSASWSRSEWEVAYGAAEPTNVWGHIRVGQMVQISNEFLGRLLGQTCVEADWNPFCGSPADRLGEFAAGRTDYVACMIDGITKGHNVTPYWVDAGDIRVYDNNVPEAVSHLTVTGDTYSFPNTGYSGSGLFSVPLSLWRNGRTAPLFGTFDLLVNWVAGSADALVTTAGGERWGWLPDGTFVNEIPGSFTMTPQSGDFDGRSVPLALPASHANPQITVNADGGDYYVHAGQNGVVAQIHAFDSLAGDTDQIALKYDAQNSLKSLQYTPQRTAGNAVPAIGMKIGTDKSLLFRWMGADVPGGKSVEVAALKNNLGAEYVNLTGGATSAYMLVNGADGTAQEYSQVLFGPIAVPNGASQKSAILNWPDSTIIRSDLDFDRNGTVDQTQNIQGVVPQAIDNIGDAKLKTDGTLVSLQRVVATTSQSTFGGFLYCQDPGGTTGIKVMANSADLPGVVPGTMLQVIGHMSTDADGERQVISHVLIINHAESQPGPLVMKNKAVGGGTFGSPPAGQIGTTGSGPGLNTIGSLVRTTGRVLFKSGSTAVISDGSGSVELDLTNAPVPFEPGAYVEVTGISALKVDGATRPRYIVLRSPADLVFH